MASPINKTITEFAKRAIALRYRSEMKSLESIDSEEYERVQVERFARIYADAVKHVAYYRDRPDKYPPNLQMTGSLQGVLSELPLLPKANVKEQQTQFLRVPPKRFTRQHTTGGTTGTPLSVAASLVERGYTEAILEQRDLNVTGERFPRTVRLSGFLPGSESDGRLYQSIPGTNLLYISIYDLGRGDQETIRRLVRGFRPQLLHGYASALHQFALLFESEPTWPKDRPLAVISTSETLQESQRSDIEMFLEAEVFNEYGSQEGQHLVLECSKRGLHVHPTRGAVELLNASGEQEQEPGVLANVVVTGLMSQSMPLIRYQLGDSALVPEGNQPCGCGSHWPVIGQIEGRTEDLIAMPDGRRIGLLSHSTLKDVQGIIESQLVQRDFDNFVYKLVLSEEGQRQRQSLETTIAYNLRSRLGEDIRVSFEYPERVPRTAAGKIRAVVVEFQP